MAMNNRENLGMSEHKTSAFNVHVEKMEKRLQHWNDEFDKFADTAHSPEGAEKPEFQSQLTDLQEKLDFAYSRLEALRSAGEHKWEAYKDELDLALRHLETSFNT